MSVDGRWRLIKPSTREFIREARRTPGFSVFKFIHGYVYARWIYLYIRVGRGQHWLAKVFGPLFKFISERIPKTKAENHPMASGTIADGYHGKVMPLDTAKRLIMVEENVELKNLEKVIPYPVAKDIVLQNPDHIVVLDCACRLTKENPCLPIDVCMVIGEPMTSMVRDYHPDRSRWISQQEAVDLLTAEHERGHVHHAFFKDAMLGRYYAICNCCSCCCAGMFAHQNGVPMVASSGYECVVQAESCVGCGSCEEICPFDAIHVHNGTAEVDLPACMGCGVCVPQCPSEALSLVRNPDRGEPLEIEELLGNIEKQASQVRY